jgi:hypothetical protein
MPAPPAEPVPNAGPASPPVQNAPPQSLKLSYNGDHETCPVVRTRIHISCPNATPMSRQLSWPIVASPLSGAVAMVPLAEKPVGSTGLENSTGSPTGTMRGESAAVGGNASQPPRTTTAVINDANHDEVLSLRLPLAVSLPAFGGWAASVRPRALRPRLAAGVLLSVPMSCTGSSPVAELRNIDFGKHVFTKALSRRVRMNLVVRGRGRKTKEHAPKSPHL